MQMMKGLGKRSKYNVDTSKAGREGRTWRDEAYDSKDEMEYAQQLELQKKAGLIKDWQRQIPFRLVVNGSLIATHYCDFKIVGKEGVWYEEFKGVETAAYKMKRKLLKALYPTVDYRVVRK